MAFKAILGLGNPSDYDETYHNAGMAFANFLAKDSSVAAAKDSFTAYRLDNGALAIIPHCFMNESGPVVAAALSYFKIAPRELILAHDDSDIEIGRFKMGFARGAAGHHGVESIIATLKTNEFARVRIGIRPVHTQDPSAPQRLKAGDFVLKKISHNDARILQGVFEAAARETRKLMENVTPSGPDFTLESGN